MLASLVSGVRTGRVEAWPTEDARSQLSALARLSAWIQARECEIVAHLCRDTDKADLAAAAIDIAHCGRRTPSSARALISRSLLADSFPVVGSALRRAAISTAHVDAIVRSIKRAGESSTVMYDNIDSLVQLAGRLPVDQFARRMNNLVDTVIAARGGDVAAGQRARTQLRIWSDTQGMVHLHGSFDPERGALITARLDAMVEAAFHGGDDPAQTGVDDGVDPNDARRAHALFEAVCGAPIVPSGSGSGGFATGPRTELVVTVDLQTLTDGLHASSVHRTMQGIDLPVEAIRRLACGADIIPMVLNGDGVVIDIGRSSRLATWRQRRALLAMYSQCAVPGCSVSVHHCVPHHIDYWRNGGGTDLGNLVPLCSRHHHCAHEGGWRLTLDEQRTLHVLLPDGRAMSRRLEHVDNVQPEHEGSGAVMRC